MTNSEDLFDYKEHVYEKEVMLTSPAQGDLFDFNVSALVGPVTKKANA